MVGELADRDLLDRHRQHALHHGSVLMAAGKAELDRDVEMGGVARHFRRMGDEGVDPLEASRLRLEQHLLEVLAVVAHIGVDQPHHLQQVVAVDTGPRALQDALDLQEATGRIPHPRLALGGGTDEDHRQPDIGLLGAVVDPHLRRPGLGAQHFEIGERGAVDQQDPRPVVAQAAVFASGLRQPEGPTLLELVARGLGIRVADFPELLDEGVALVVPLEPQKELALAGGDQGFDLLQPALEARIGLLLGLLCFGVGIGLGGLGLGDGLVLRGDRGRLGVLSPRGQAADEADEQPGEKSAAAHTPTYYSFS